MSINKITIKLDIALLANKISSSLRLLLAAYLK